MKVLEGFTNHRGSIIRLIEYDGYFERKMYGWRYSIETITASITHKKGFGELKYAEFEFKTMFIRTERFNISKKYRTLSSVPKLCNDPLFIDISELLINIDLMNIEVSDFILIYTYGIFSELGYNHIKKYPIPSRFKNIIDIAEGDFLILYERSDFGAEVIYYSRSNKKRIILFQHPDSKEFEDAIAYFHEERIKQSYAPSRSSY